MADPFTAFQISTSALGLAVQAGEIVRNFTARVRHARDLGDDALTRLGQAELLLQNTRDVVNSQGDRGARTAVRRGGLNIDVEESFRISGEIVDELLASVTTVTNGQGSLPDRIRFAWNHHYISRRLDILNVHSNILRDTLLALNVSATINGTDDVLQELGRLHRLLEAQTECRSHLQDALRVEDEAGPSTQGSNGGPVVDGETHGLAETVGILDRWLSDAGTVYEGLVSQHGLDTQSVSDRSRRSQHLPHLSIHPREPEPQLENDQPAYQTSVEALFPLAPRSLANATSLLTLQNWIACCKAEAHACLNKKTWQQAEDHLKRAIDYYKQCIHRRQRMSLWELVDLTDCLVRVQQKLNNWIDSTSESRRLLELVSNPNVQNFILESSHQVQSSVKAQCLQSLANILYVRYKRCTGAAADLEEARSRAEEARGIRDSAPNSTEAGSEELNRQAACLQLLILIYNALDMTVEAGDPREALANLLPASQSADGLSLNGSVHINDSPMSPASRSTSLFRDTEHDFHSQLIGAILSGCHDDLRQFLPFRSYIDINACDGNDTTPLMHAVSVSNVQGSLVNQLLGPDWRAQPNVRNKAGTTALHTAANLDLPDTAQILIKHGANMHRRDYSKVSPLMLAMQLGHNEFAQRLLGLDNKVYLRLRDDCFLHWAVRNCSALTITRLLDGDSDRLLARKQDKRCKQTALHVCAELLKTEHAKAILDHSNFRGGVNVPDKENRTALYYVVNKPFENEACREFARVIFSHDNSALEHCREARYYRDYCQYGRRLQENQRRTSEATRTTSRSSRS